MKLKLFNGKEFFDYLKLINMILHRKHVIIIDSGFEGTIAQFLSKNFLIRMYLSLEK